MWDFVVAAAIPIVYVLFFSVYVYFHVFCQWYCNVEHSKVGTEIDIVLNVSVPIGLRRSLHALASRIIHYKSSTNTNATVTSRPMAYCVIGVAHWANAHPHEQTSIVVDIVHFRSICNFLFYLSFLMRPSSCRHTDTHYQLLYWSLLVRYIRSQTLGNVT